MAAEKGRERESKGGRDKERDNNRKVKMEKKWNDEENRESVNMIMI